MTLRTIKKSWQEILDNEGIKGWEIDDTHSDGLVMSESRKILCSRDNDALFLHEIAHVLTQDWNKRIGDKTGHHAIWGDKLTYLVDKYMRLK